MRRTYAGRRRGVGVPVEAEHPLGVEGEDVGLAAVAEEVVGPDAVAVEDGSPDRVVEGLGSQVSDTASDPGMLAA